MVMILVITLLIFLFFFSLSCAVFFLFFAKKKAIDKLKFFDSNHDIEEKLEKNKKNKNTALKSLSNLVPSSKLDKKKTKKLEMDLIKADLPMTVSEFYVVTMVFSTLAALIGYLLSSSAFFCLLVFFIGWNIPKVVVGSKIKERHKAFDNQLNDGITIISNSLKAGYSFLQAVAVVSEEMPDPFAKEFKKLLKEMSLGLSEEEAFKNLTNRMESEDLKLIINAIVIQKDVGGNLSEVLDNIGETIRERQKIKNELKTLTAQGKLSGFIVGALPVFLGLAIFLLNREYVSVLFTTKIGLILVFSSLVSEVLGFMMIRKIVDIKM